MKVNIRYTKTFVVVSTRDPMTPKKAEQLRQHRNRIEQSLAADHPNDKPRVVVSLWEPEPARNLDHVLV